MSGAGRGWVSAGSREPGGRGIVIGADTGINSGHAGRGAGHGGIRTRQTHAGGAVARLRAGRWARVRRKVPATDGGGTDRAGRGGASRVGAEGTTMQELRFVAVSEDGRYAVLAVPGRSARFMLPIDERLRAVALGQTSRLAQYEIEVESPLRPKEIQARIRAGETVEEIADAAGIAIERVRWFEGPVLAERAYVADQAQTASVRRHGDSTPGPRLGEIVAERLNAFGADPEDAQWDAKKRGDGSWQVQLDLHLRRPPAYGRVDLRSAAQACDPGGRQRRPDVTPRGRPSRADRTRPGHRHFHRDEAQRGPSTRTQDRTRAPAHPSTRAPARPSTRAPRRPGTRTSAGT